MAKKQSKFLIFVLYPFLGLVFVAASAVMAFYAMGYNLNYQNGKIESQRTGAIILSSRPGDAVVYVGSQKYSSNTPLFSFLTIQVSDLKPGEYRVRLEKAAYENWTGVFKVDAGMVSWGTQILMLPTKRTASAYNMPSEIESMISSSDKSRELVVTNDKANQTIAVWQINTQTKERQTLFEKRLSVGESYHPISYSYDNQMILFEHDQAAQKSFVAYQAIPNGTNWDITDTFKTTFDSFVFNPRNHNELYALRSGDMFKISLTNKTLSAALFSNVKGIYPDDAGLMFIQKNDAKTNLYTLTSSDKQTMILQGLTDSESYQAAFMTNNFGYAILPASTRTLVVYRPNGNVDAAPTKIAENVDFILPSAKSQFLGFGNKDSFYTYENYSGRLYTAYTGRQVSSIAWFNDQFNLAYIENGQLKMITYRGDYDKYIFAASNDFPIVTAADAPRLFYVATNPTKKILDLYSYDFNT